MQWSVSDRVCPTRDVRHCGLRANIQGFAYFPKERLRLTSAYLPVGKRLVSRSQDCWLLTCLELRTLAQDLPSSAAQEFRMNHFDFAYSTWRAKPCINVDSWNVLQFVYPPFMLQIATYADRNAPYKLAFINCFACRGISPSYGKAIGRKIWCQLMQHWFCHVSVFSDTAFFDVDNLQPRSDLDNILRPEAWRSDAFLFHTPRPNTPSNANFFNKNTVDGKYFRSGTLRVYGVARRMPPPRPEFQMSRPIAKNEIHPALIHDIIEIWGRGGSVFNPRFWSTSKTLSTTAVLMFDLNSFL